jgi:hypothetical protein
LLLQGLDLPDADLRANVIEALLAICPNEPAPSESLSKLPQSGWSIVSEHIGSLISSTLRNAVIRPGQVSSVVSPVPRVPLPRVLIDAIRGKRLRDCIFALIGRTGYDDTI